MTGRQQLDRVRTELDEVDASAARLASSCSLAAWQSRPADGGWSPSECVQHLVLSVDAMLARMDVAVRVGLGHGVGMGCKENSEFHEFRSLGRLLCCWH